MKKEHGPGYYDNRTWRPTDPEVWQVILGFHDYMDALPAKLEKDGIGIIVPYNNATAMREYIADKTNRTIALFYLADLPSQTVDKTTKQVVSGISGMKKFVEQLLMEYEEIIKSYPNGKVFAWGKERDIRTLYYDWLDDRYHHGLSKTVDQFVGGWDDNKYHNPYGNIDWVQSQNGIDQFLTKNWKPWDLVKFIYGYERFRAGDWGGEWEMYRYGLPLAFKAFGIPYAVISGRPYIMGTMSGEWAVSLPDEVVISLRQAFPNARIAIGYGNLISLYSCIDGLEKDGVQEIFQAVRGNLIYLWKK